MKRKLLVMSMLIVLVVTIMSGCKKKETVSVNSLERVKKAGKITIAIDDSFPPMEYRDDKNTLMGFDIDFALAIGEKLGVKVEHIPTDWNGIIEALKAKKFDMILSTLSITDERKQKIDFSDPYLMEGQIIVTQNGNTAIKSKDDLTGKIVACQLGTTGEEAGKKLTGLKELKPYDKITEAFHDLTIGRVNCVIVDELVGRYYIAKSPADYTVLADKLTDEPVGIGFNKDDKELREAVQKAINELTADGTMSKISLKWFGVDYYKK
jgi:polar amino acid transport system substrate-binding protein